MKVCALTSILLLFTALFLGGGCAKKISNLEEGPSDGGQGGQEVPVQDPSEPPPADETEPDFELPAKITLQAQKSYRPSAWQDGIYSDIEDLKRDVQLKIALPASIEVISGNAGNHQLDVTIDEDLANVVCAYKGGADVSKPLKSSNSGQILKGQKYLFKSCSQGSVAGDLVTMDSRLRVSVKNGDSTETTVVRAAFAVASP